MSLIIVRQIYWIKNENIVVTEGRIAYDTPGLILETLWQNLSKTGFCWRYGVRQECMIVDQSDIKITKWAVYANSYPRPLNNFVQGVCIPLSCFSDNWRDSELGHQIKQYALHLFQ